MNHQKTMPIMFGFFAATAVISNIPFTLPQTLAMILTLVLIIALYILRSKAEDKSSDHQIYTHLIKTFWLWSVIYVVGLLIAGIIISKFGDPSALNNWAESIANGAVPDEESTNAAIQLYMDSNNSLIMTATAICLLPSTGFALFRLFKGFKALKTTAE